MAIPHHDKTNKMYTQAIMTKLRRLPAIKAPNEKCFINMIWILFSSQFNWKLTRWPFGWQGKSSTIEILFLNGDYPDKDTSLQFGITLSKKVSGILIQTLLLLQIYRLGSMVVINLFLGINTNGYSI